MPRHTKSVCLATSCETLPVVSCEFTKRSIPGVFFALGAVLWGILAGVVLSVYRSRGLNWHCCARGTDQCQLDD
eukprot:4373514-Amphidinium_carterae.2